MGLIDDAVRKEMSLVKDSLGFLSGLFDGLLGAALCSDQGILERVFSFLVKGKFLVESMDFLPEFSPLPQEVFQCFGKLLKEISN